MHQDVDAFLTELRAARGVAPTTARGYANDLLQCAAFLQEQNLAPAWAEVRPAHLRRYLAHLHERSYARATIARKLSALRALYRHLLARASSTSPTWRSCSPRRMPPPPRGCGIAPSWRRSTRPGCASQS
jgi:site-specific recombinase XerD